MLLPITLVRFCLVGLMVIARLLCPCPEVKSAHAATSPKGHACCDQAAGQKGSSKTAPADGTGCSHCADSPQIKPTMAEGPEAPIGDVIDHFLSIHSFALVSARLDTSRSLACDGSEPPPKQLMLLRSVVLLI